MSARTKRLVVQQLESLQRSGVRQLARRTTSEVKVILTDSGSTELAAPSDRQVSDSDSAPGQAAELRRDPSHASNSSPVMDLATTSTLAQRQAELALIQREVAACRRCEHLACTRTQTVFGVGNALPRLCFLGEAPGADEDRRGEPFVGRAGQLLTDILVKGMRLERSDVYILNVLKCRPPDNRTPTEEEMANCREYLERQLKVLQPEFICCLGATAVRALLQRTQTLGRLRGQWFSYGTARVMITYHPSYLLRNPAAKKDTWEDIQMLMREMNLPISNPG